MSSSFQGRLARNIGWQSLTMMARVGISIIALSVLARIGGPEVMGIYGITWVLPAIFLAVLQTGAAQSIFLIDDLTKGHLTAAILSTMGIATFGALLIAASGPLASHYYALPALTDAFGAAAMFMLFMGLGVVDLAINQKKLDFRTVAMVQTTANLGSSLLGVLLGYLGHPLLGLLALQGTISPLQFLIFRLKRQPVEFAWPTWSEVKDVWRHGVHLTLNTVTANVLTNYVQLILAATLPVHQLGLFTLCRRIVELINNQIGGVVGQVLFPSVAAHRKNLAEIARTYLLVSRITATVMMAPLVVIISVPSQFLQLFGGAEWIDGENTLIMLCFMQAGLSLGQNLFGVMQAIGRASLVWKWNLAFMMWQCALVLIYGRKDATAAAAAMAVSTLVMPIAAYILSRMLQFSMTDWILSYCRVFVPAALTTLAIQFAHIEINVSSNTAVNFVLTMSCIGAIFIVLAATCNLDVICKRGNIWANRPPSG